MPKAIYEVSSEHFHISDKQKYILQGLWPDDSIVEVYLDRTQIPAEIHEKKEIGAMERYKDKNIKNASRVGITVDLPENISMYKKLCIYAIGKNKRVLWFTISVKKLRKKQTSPNVFIEERKWDPDIKRLEVRGWAVDQTPVQIKVLNARREPVESSIVWINRPDVSNMFDEAVITEKCGFFLQIQAENEKKIYLTFQSGQRSLDLRTGWGVWSEIREKINGYWEKSWYYLKNYGFKALVHKAEEKIRGFNKKPIVYSKWLPKHLPSQKTLQYQRETNFDYTPKFSIVVPLYKTPAEYLEDMIHSVQIQTYSNWELCLSDGSGSESPLKESLMKYQKEDSRIKVINHDVPLQISENTNAALQIAEGDFIVFMDHDDVLCAHALFECAEVLNKNPDIEVIYSDEDKMTMDGHNFFQPHFKPDFNIDLLCSVNYICHLFVVKRGLQKNVGELRKEFDGAQDYDFIFRCVENTRHIYHIPKILYHWRSHEHSTAENPESKEYAFDAGKRAIQEHYNRKGIHASVEKGEFQGLYKSKYFIDNAPLISILIPNKDHIEDLKRCVDSLDQKSRYRNYEIIVIENNSTEKETFAYYKKLQDEHPNIHVVYWKGIFNYSEINNFGAKFAQGDYLLLLNNDTEIINPECLEELLGYCSRGDVGIVGARLYYGDDTIQHAGVVIGFGGIAGHCFVQQPRSSTGYCHRIICAQDYSAVTAACMMVKKSVYDEVNGFTPELQVAFNDIDFCLKVRQAGYLVVYNPYAELYHYESKSRGLEDTPEKIERFNNEIQILERRWPHILKNGDPYYNPNLSLETQDFSLKRL